jgi:hypothetical protein
MNFHAIRLEKILITRGVRLEKKGQDWKLSNGGGKTVVYSPATGVCLRFDALLGKRTRDELRGNPERVAEILEEYVR